MSKLTLVINMQHNCLNHEHAISSLTTPMHVPTRHSGMESISLYRPIMCVVAWL